MYPNDPTQQPVPQQPQPQPQVQPQPFVQPQPAPQPQYQPQPVAPVPAPAPITTPSASPAGYTSPAQSAKGGLPLFGLISLALGVVGLILLPVLFANTASYLIIIIPLIIGLASVGVAAFALRGASKISTIVLAGFVIGAIVFSLSLNQLIQSSILSAKLEAYSNELKGL